LIQAHIETIRLRRAELESFERTLTDMAARCDATCATNPTENCTIFADVLEDARAVGAR